MSFTQRRYQLIQQVPRNLLEAVLVIFVVLLVLLTLDSGAKTEALLVTLGLFGVASIRLMPMGSQLSATMTKLRFKRNTVSRLYNDLQQVQALSIKETVKSKENSALLCLFSTATDPLPISQHKTTCPPGLESRNQSRRIDWVSRTLRKWQNYAGRCLAWLTGTSIRKDRI